MSIENPKTKIGFVQKLNKKIEKKKNSNQG